MRPTLLPDTSCPDVATGGLSIVHYYTPLRAMPVGMSVGRTLSASSSLVIEYTDVRFRIYSTDGNTIACGIRFHSSGDRTVRLPTQSYNIC